MENNESKIFDCLNAVQKEAVECVDGPVLIVAGAGSGKTRVLTSRIAYLVQSGIDPGRILALTFTKKAAGEMMERIRSMIGGKARRIYMGTFHSVFIKFLREYASEIGYPQSFTIYDTNDSRNAVKACVKELGLDEKTYKPAEVFSRISMAKNNLITENAYRNNPQLVQSDFAARKGRICDIYSLYAKRCKASGVMDFDDILLNMNILLRDHPSALAALRERFSHILVDEYQDTNYAQYLIIKKLSEESRNICVVGDDSQSIYAFRGARVENILNFKKDYPDCHVFRLEQNYRSTRVIVNAANSLIEKNKERIEKKCFSQGVEGEKIRIINAFTEQEEAILVTSSIVSKITSDSAQYQDFAILYRTNAQSRALEEALRKRNIPYKIYSGRSFYDRAEIKDVVAYLKLAVNPKDDEALKRVINLPARGIGQTSMSLLAGAAAERGISLWETISSDILETVGLKPAAIARIRDFVNMISVYAREAAQKDAVSVAKSLTLASGIYAMYKEDKSMEGMAKLENIDELLNAVEVYAEEEANTRNELYQIENGTLPDDAPVITLSDFLENVSLMSDADTDDDDEAASSNKVTLMTVHSSKGLEFPYVYVVGMEENLFPSSGGGMATEREIEEERRLFYVALTRAEKCVVLSLSSSRMKYGQHVSNPPSRFLREIDSRYLSNPPASGRRFSEEDVFVPVAGPARQLSSGGQSRQASLAGRSRQIPAGQGRYDSVSGRESAMAGDRPQAVSRGREADMAHGRMADNDFVPDPVLSFRPGMRVEHSRFGTGMILQMEGSGSDLKAIVKFDHFGEKTLLMKFAKLRAVR